MASLLGVSAYLPPLEGFFTPVLSPLPKKDPVGRCVCVVLGIAVTFGAPSMYRSRKRPETVVSDIERSPSPPHRQC